MTGRQIAQALCVLSIIQLFVWQIILCYDHEYFRRSLLARLAYWFSIVTAVIAAMFLHMTVALE